jgi:hypothetical protein
MGEGRRQIISIWAYKSFREKIMGKLVLTVVMATTPMIK